MGSVAAPPPASPDDAGRGIPTQPILLDQYGRPLLPRRAATTSGEPPRYPTYSLPASTFRSVCGGLLVAVALFLAAAIVAGGGELRWIALVIALFFALLIWRVRTVATTTTPDGVVARGLMRTRRFSWSEIQDVRVEVHPGTGPMYVVVLYDRSGRDTILPNINERDLAARRLSLDAEVDALRAEWRRRRGPDWALLPDVRRRIERRANAGMNPWILGTVAASTTLLPILVLALIVFPLGIADDRPPWSIVFSLWFGMACYLLTLVAVSGMVILRRRRDITS
jgi:Bacterial PH domain